MIKLIRVSGKDGISVSDVVRFMAMQPVHQKCPVSAAIHFPIVAGFKYYKDKASGSPGFKRQDDEESEEMILIA